MPTYDRRCDTCGAERLETLEPITFPDPTCDCSGTLKRVIIGGTALNPRRLHNVVGDECDVLVTNGLCNEDGSPRRYTSKTEMATEAARRGLTNYVVHQPGRGSDKSRHTSRWV